MATVILVITTLKLTLSTGIQYNIKFLMTGKLLYFRFFYIV